MSSAISKIAEMMTIQNGLNTKSYDTAWLEKGQTGEFDYRIAGGQELGEFLDSLPYSWWSGAKPDRANCITELVDAWHFIMSQVIVERCGNLDAATAEVVAGYNDSNDGEGVQDDRIIKSIARGAIAALYGDGLYIEKFFNLCTAYGVSLELLYARYIGKSTLNKFRVENGYKVKEYAKLWDFGGDRAEGTKLDEDNYYLSRWIDACVEKGQEPNAEEVHAWLTEQYSQVVNDPRRAHENVSTAPDEIAG